MAHPLTWAAALLALVALSATAVIVFTGDEAAAAEVSLEAAASEGTDPFMDSIATDAVPTDGIEPGGVEEISTSADAPVANLTGDTPGLYGGTGQDTVCDPDAMVDFLDDNPDKARAFATVLGLTPNGIADYVATLTPVLLREDTRVTNHGFTNGTATPIQSVLQAGSAVLVDQRGTPRVRCTCGNPLLEPADPTAPADFTGDPWAGFDQNRLLAIQPADQDLDTLTITDIDTGQTNDIPTGGGAGITEEQLLNATIPGPPDFGSGEPVTLVDGVGPPNSSGSAPTIAGVQEGSPELGIGDVTGDGRDDGVITVFETFGASTLVSTTYLFDASGELLGIVPVGDHIPAGASFPPGVSSQVVDGEIVLDVAAYAPDECHACGPSIQLTLRFVWDDGFVLQ
jgi:hypothetical protein